MYAVIGGMGEVGFHIARSLYDEGYNLSIIDDNPDACNRAENFDALVVRGNAASPKKLEEAGISTADLFIGVTGSDEINMIACAIAHSKKCKTIARINSLDYIDEPIVTQRFSYLGIDVAVCPELMASIKMARMLTMPSVVDTEIFAKGKVQIIEDVVLPNSQAANQLIKEIPLPEQCNLVAVFRKGTIIIPSGNEKLAPNDRVVLILAHKEMILQVRKLFGSGKDILHPKATSRVMINGASRIGMSLAKLLEGDIDVVLLEADEDLSKEASESLLGTLVIQGNGTDESLLIDEGIDQVDAFISTTPREGLNILSCILAKQFGAKKTLALIDRPELKMTLEHTGIDLIVSPRLATVSGILQHVHHTKMLSLSILQQGEARILELKVSPQSKISGKKLKWIRFPKNTRVGAIVRRDRVIIPTGDVDIIEGDSLVMFARTEEITRLMEMF
jgi:trk system potassium uptake protein TrkA